MASSTVTATAFSSGTHRKGHLRLVDPQEAHRLATQRQLQWEAVQAGHSSRVRLTKRGRRVVASLVLLPLAATMWFTAGKGAVAQGTKPTTRTVVVQPGQSLWGIAQAVAPKADPRETIYKIKQLNQLADSSLSPGQAVIVPTGN